MRPLPSLKWLTAMGGIYFAASLSWSLLGLLTPVTPAHFHEYSVAAFLVEIGGHLLWGFAAGLFTLDPALVLLVTGESVLIDVDHLFSALNFPIEPRMSHSIFFAVMVALLLAYVGRRGPRLDRGIFWATLGSVAGHFSYDVYAGYALFPVISPLSNAYFGFPYYSWVVFEALAVVLCLLSWFPKLGASKGEADPRKAPATWAPGGQSWVSPNVGPEPALITSGQAPTVGCPTYGDWRPWRRSPPSSSRRPPRASRCSPPLTHTRPPSSPTPVPRPTREALRSGRTFR